ncbi:hypothetical protein CYG27_RS03350 [Vibrio parahaemolyticus]|uniref:hypothetical protein n=1 Tax=Gammaproteobacteria TaxID=1236 RepID=UPI0004656D98|nr:MULTISPECIES: hypothetical protein [Gammaproteobacteria]KIT48848.1 hypothetical protein H331_15865 [Vibrio parahaemolyticus 3644]AWG80052.1 hypothetical protein C9I78_15215 [Vibrio parahaemolyticus]AWJ79680.1 hypothetical protein C7Y67_15330 [Vibrio parahaemolyticus]EGQ8121713.1 hypothetical protein [Vibrio cholerae]EGQ8262024.1 hypothetical protein [Vibrio parahaemolyticus]
MKLNNIELLTRELAQHIKTTWIVQIEFPEQNGNQGPDGDLLWPEVLLCKSEKDAIDLAHFLNKASHEDFELFMASEASVPIFIPNSSEQHVVISCRNIEAYRYAYLIEPSIESISQVEILMEVFQYED